VAAVLSPRRVERKLDERDELMEWLILGELAGRIAVGEIECAVLERKSPVQRVNLAREHRAKLAGVLIDSKIYGAAAHRMLESDRAGDG